MWRRREGRGSLVCLDEMLQEDQLGQSPGRQLCVRRIRPSPGGGTAPGGAATNSKRK